MSSTVPLWVALLLGLSPSLVAIAAIVAAEVRERRRQEHELKSRLRDERIEAYRKLLTATSTAHYDTAAIRVLAEGYAEIALLAETQELVEAAQAVWFAYGTTQRASSQVKKDPDVSTAQEYAQALPSSEEARRRFLELAREELGVEDRSEGFRDLEAPTPGDILQGPETPAS